MQQQLNHENSFLPTEMLIYTTKDLDVDLIQNFISSNGNDLTPTIQYTLKSTDHCSALLFFNLEAILVYTALIRLLCMPIAHIFRWVTSHPAALYYPLKKRL